MKITLLDKTKKKKFIAEIEQFGIHKIHELLLRSGKERIRAYSGDLSKEELMALWRILPIEGIGLYVGKDMIDRHGKREVRLSMDGIHAWQDQITHNIFDIDTEQEKQWFLGKNIELENNALCGFVIVRSKESQDFIGMGKISLDGKILYNYLPKERRRKSNTI